EPGDGSTPSHGTVTLAAGESPTGTPSNYNLYTTLDLYNNTAIPIDTNPDPKSEINDVATVTIGTDDLTQDPHYGINAAGDILLAADRGDITTTAVGTGKDIYLEALAAAASAISEVFGGGSVSFEHHGGTTVNDGTSTVTVNGL